MLALDLIRDLLVARDLRFASIFGKNKNQWAEGRAAGGNNFFKDPRFAGMLEGRRKSMGRRAGRGRVYLFQKPSICGYARGKQK